MKHELTLIKTPQLGTNENIAVLVEWSIQNKEKSDSGDIICSLETTKTTFDVESEVSGYVIHLVDVGDEVSVGDSLAIIGPNLEILIEEKNRLLDKSKQKSYKATKKAELLAKELDIDLAKLNISGIIKEIDVADFAKINCISSNKEEQHNDNKIARKIELIGNSKNGKELMIYSNSNIPHSYIERSVIIDDWTNTLEKYEENEGKLITILSLIICSLGKALKENDIFNSYRENNTIFIYKNVNVGVVLSLEDNLSVPVIKEVDKLTPDEAIKILIRIRKEIHKRKSNPVDFIDGTITVSAMNHTEVTSFIPIIHPKQSAVLAIPKIQNKFDVDDNGSFVNVKYINLGMSFDHSFLDANQANNFLGILIGKADEIIDTIWRKY